MIILALDMASKTGWAIADSDAGGRPTVYPGDAACVEEENDNNEEGDGSDTAKGGTRLAFDCAGNLFL